MTGSYGEPEAMSCRSIALVSKQVDALRAVEGWPAQQRRRRRRPGGRRPRTATPAREFRWASVTKPVTALACLVAAEEGTIDLDEPAGPPGSTVPPPARARVGPAARGCEPDREAGRAADLLRPRLRRPRRGARRGTRRCRSPTTCAPPCSSRSAWARASTAGRARGIYGSLDDLLALRARAARARRSSRRRRWRRRPPSSSRASSACSRASAARSRTTGASASSSATRSRRTGRARATRRGRSATSAGAAPSSGSTPTPGLALGCLTDLDFGDWAKTAWPALSDAVLLRRERASKQQCQA